MSSSVIIGDYDGDADSVHAFVHAFDKITSVWLRTIARASPVARRLGDNVGEPQSLLRQGTSVDQPTLTLTLTVTLTQS